MPMGLSWRAWMRLNTTDELGLALAELEAGLDEDGVAEADGETAER